MSSGSQHQTDQFDRDTIETLLTGLNDKLAEADLYGDIYISCGAKPGISAGKRWKSWAAAPSTIWVAAPSLPRGGATI